MLKRLTTVSVIAAAGFTAASPASAEMQGFIGGGLGFNTIAADETLEAPPGPNVELTFGKSNFAVQLEGGVRFDSPGTVVSLGLYVHPLNYKADEADLGGLTSKTEIKTLWGVFGELGWKLAPPTVVYGRLSYNQGKGETTISDGVSETSASKTFTGFGVGAGIRHTVSGNAYLFADWHHIMGKETEVDTGFKVQPTITTGLIGVGWTFP